jgi:hypothetical protein
MGHKSVLTLTLISLIFFWYMEGWGEDWKYYGENSYHVGYYDADSITRLPEGIVRVREKDVFTEKGIMEAVEKLGEKYKALSYVIMSDEVHCVDGRIRPLSLAFYSKDGKILSSSDYPAADWGFIVPETRAEALYEILCKQR